MTNVEETPILVHQGSIQVNCAVILHKAPNIACITVDCATKYPQIDSLSSSDMNNPILHLERIVEPQGATSVEFTDFPGWEIFSSDAGGRYTVNVVLVKKGE